MIKICNFAFFEAMCDIVILVTTFLVSGDKFIALMLGFIFEVVKVIKCVVDSL